MKWPSVLAFACFMFAAPCMAADAPSDPPAPATVIHAGAVLATPGETPLGPQTIVIRDGRIVSMHDGKLPASGFGADAVLLDLSDKFLLPGLIDLHMHLAIIMDASNETATSGPRLALAAAGYSRKLLEAGVTTVRDVGDNTGVTFAMRDAFANSELEGPRVFAAGRIISRSGGHGAKQATPGTFPYEPARCDGPESCRRSVREDVEQGSDWIKVTVSGSGRESGGKADAQPIIFEDEMKAVAEAAAQADRPIAAHAHSTRAINMALAYGARTIEHGTYFDSQSATLFKNRGAFLVPTAYIADYVRSRLDMFAGGRDGRSGDDLKAWSDAAMAGPGRAWRAGIRLGLGTDGGPSFPPTATAREVQLYVDSGVPAAEAIRAATSNGAEILGMGKEIGSLQPGYQADIIAVDGDPLKDVALLQKVTFVMQGGIVRKPSVAAPSR